MGDEIGLSTSTSSDCSSSSEESSSELTESSSSFTFEPPTMSRPILIEPSMSRQALMKQMDEQIPLPSTKKRECDLPLKISETLLVERVGSQSAVLSDMQHPAGTFSTHCLGLVWRIPAETCEELLVHMQASTGEHPAFVYNFGAEATEQCDLPIDFELYRSKTSTFINLRARLKPESPDVDHQMTDNIRRSSLTACIVDDEGQVLRSEKWAPGIVFPKGPRKFEVEDFISVNEISEMLNKFGGINIQLSLTGSDLELPTLSSDPSHGLSEEEIIHRNNFEQLMFQKGYNSFLGTQTLNGDFTDAALRVQDNDEVIGIPVHRVFLAAQSRVFASLLEESSEITIEGYDIQVVAAMLDYIYSGEVHSREVDMLKSLYSLCKKYHVAGLKEKCIRNAHKRTLTDAKPGARFTQYFELGNQLQSPVLIKLALADFHKAKHIEQARGVLDLNANELSLPQYSQGKDIASVAKHLEMLNIILSGKEERLEPNSSEEVKLLGTFTEIGMGCVYKVPAFVCVQLWLDTFLSPEEDVQQSSEKERIYFEYNFNMDPGTTKNNLTGTLQVCKVSSSKEVNLRFIDLDTDEDESSYEKELTSGIDDLDTETVTTLGLTLTASLYNKTGRIVHEAQCKSYKKSETERVWHVKPFFSTASFDLQELVDGNGDMMIRISIGIKKTHPTLALLDPVKDESEFMDLENYDEEFLRKVMVGPFNNRLLAQLGNPLFSDAVLHVVGKDEKRLRSISVHRVIISAFSSVLAEQLEDSAEICLSIDNYGVASIEAFLVYMYSGQVPDFDIDLGLELLCAAKELNLLGLTDYTIERMLNLPISFGSAIVFYKLGVSIQSRPVMSAAMKYFHRNQKQLLHFQQFKDFLQEHPELAERFKVVSTDKMDTTNTSTTE